MEIVYILCESKRIRIPLFGYDKRLYSFFISRGGAWNKTRGEFTFDGNTNVERLYRAAPGVPLVIVNDQSPVPMRVFGFLGRPWEQTAFYLETEMRTAKYSRQTRRSEYAFGYTFRATYIRAHAKKSQN